MANYYQNANLFFVEVPIPTNGTIGVKSGEFVKGTFFAGLVPPLTDLGAGVPAAVTANAALLVYTQNENATAPNVLGDSVGTTEIEALAVTTGKINDLAVTTGKLATDAVTTAKILNSNVTSTKLNVAGTPTAADDAGLTGNIKFDGTYIYLCTAPDTWIRFAHVASTWA